MADRHVVPPRQLRDLQPRVGQMFADVHPHHLEQHLLGAVPARHRGGDVPQHHEQYGLAQLLERHPPAEVWARRAILDKRKSPATSSNSSPQKSKICTAPG